MSMELWNDDTNTLLCRNEPVYVAHAKPPPPEHSLTSPRTQRQRSALILVGISLLVL